MPYYTITANNLENTDPSFIDEANGFNQEHNGWVYEIPSYSSSNLMNRWQSCKNEN